jgi:hypothetical protein
MSEFHVRKVREVETGGQPTPFDKPYKLIMNLSHTGFNSWETREALFQPVHFQEDEQKAIDFSDFMSK